MTGRCERLWRSCCCCHDNGRIAGTGPCGPCVGLVLEQLLLEPSASFSWIGWAFMAFGARQKASQCVQKILEGIGAESLKRHGWPGSVMRLREGASGLRGGSGCRQHQHQSPSDAACPDPRMEVHNCRLSCAAFHCPFM